MRTDGQMDMTKLIVAFRNFANAPKNQTIKNLAVLWFLLQRGCRGCDDGVLGKTALLRLLMDKNRITFLGMKCLGSAQVPDAFSFNGG
jgi:hypothetical protein